MRMPSCPACCTSDQDFSSVVPKVSIWVVGCWVLLQLSAILRVLKQGSYSTMSQLQISQLSYSRFDSPYERMKQFSSSDPGAQLLQRVADVQQLADGPR